MIGIGSEALIFLYAVLGGMAVFSAYCVLICFRRIIKHGRALTGLEDILFWIGASGFIFKQMYDTTYGSIRWYFILGVVSGAALGFGLFCLERKLQVKFKKSLEKYRKRR